MSLKGAFSILVPCAAVLVACGSSASRSDGGAVSDAKEDHRQNHDGGRDAEADAASDGTTAKDIGKSNPPDAGPPACYGPSDCADKQLCCDALGAERPGATCLAATSCPTGLTEVCGKMGNEVCSSGVCDQYRCTFEKSGLVTELYACKIAFVQGVACGVVPDGGFPPSGDASTD